jgi:hypothetical protein
MWESLRNLLTSSDVDGALKLLEIIGFVGVAGGGLVALLRRLNGRSITSVARGSMPGDVVVRFPSDDGSETSVVVPLEVLKLYQEIAVQRELAALLRTLEKEAIDTIAFFPSDRAAPTEPVVLTKHDKAIAQVVGPEPETVLDTTQRMALSIRSLAFQEGNKWRLFDGQNIITATIEDPDFLSLVDRSVARFAKGDILMCTVRTVQMQTAEGLKTEHTVLRVDEHRPAPTQLTIRYDPPADAP